MNETITGPLDVTAVAVFCGRTNADEAAALMRRAVAAFVAVPGITFFNEKDRAILERPDGLAPEWRKKPVFLSDAASNYGVILHHFWREDAPYHYLAISPDSDVQAEELESEWNALTARLQPVLDALEPDMVVAFAQRPEAASDPLNYGELCPGARNRVLTPWTFFGSRMLDPDARKRVAALPRISTKSLRSGLSVTVVATPGTAPDPEFRKALKASGDVAYVDPLLSK